MPAVATGALSNMQIDTIAEEIVAYGYLSCEAAELDGWIVAHDEKTRLAIDASIMRLCVGTMRLELRVA